MILKIVLFLLIFTLSTNNAFCSAWTRDKGEGLVILEMLNESDNLNTLFSNRDISFYRTNSYKLYLEYGLLDKITLGGYVKNFNFYSQYIAGDVKLKREIDNDYYLNVFVLQNIYNKNSHLFTLQYSFYAPLTYSDESKNINPMDTEYSAEFSILYGKDGDINLNNSFFRYFLNSSLSYRYVEELIYDQIMFNYLMGFRANESSYFSISYEYKYYLKARSSKENENIISRYFLENISQFKLSWHYKFLENMSTEFAIYRNYSKINANGAIFYFIFSF